MLPSWGDDSLDLCTLLYFMYIFVSTAAHIFTWPGILWLHSFSTYSLPIVLYLHSGSSARSSVFTLEVGWCLLHHIWYLTPHFLSRLSQAAGTAFTCWLTLALPVKNTFPKYQTYKHILLWLPSSTSIPAAIGGLFSITPLGVNCFPYTSKAKDTKKRCDSP